MRHTQRLIALIGIIVLVAGVVPLAAPSLAGPNDAPIRLKVATFRPGLGEEPNIPARLMATEPASGELGYYLVQFAGPIQSAWKGALVNLGVEVLEYIPEFAFKVRMTPQMAQQVRRWNNVVWVDLFHPAYKLNPNLIRSGLSLYTVRLERGVDADVVANLIASKGPQVFSRSRSSLLVAARSSQLDAIALLRDVAWVDNYRLRHKENEYGAGVIMGSDEANARGYDGSTQIVAVADTGLGDGTSSGAHRDIPASRIVAIHDWPAADSFCWNAINDGAQDVDSGHGTHTSGSVLSGGGPSGEGQGTAPAASLVFQATEDYADMTSICEAYFGYEDGYYLIGLPDDIRDLFQQAYNDGARIHSNSWGSDVSGEYTEDAANTDDFMWNHPDMLVTTSAGNAGIDANSDGYVDEDSMGSPSTSKNILTVGASEHDRQGHYECDANLTYTNPDGDSCNSLGGMNDIFTYGEAWPDDFPVGPIGTDLSAGNSEQMVAFSSRGPTDDGRIKPDVIASGTWVLSAYSDLYQEGYDGSRNPQNNAWQYDGWGFPLNQYYKYMGGTSMSNPLAAGGAAVVRDFYNKAHSHTASAALTKATLINSAVDILDENNDGANDNDYPIPNNHEGWGRVHVGNATDVSHQFVDEATGLNTGGSSSYPFEIGVSGDPFKVTLVWTDYPGSVNADPALVNDLDLVVTAPDGSTTYLGNVFSGGWSQTGGSADRINNVENVYVQSAASGTWTVEVSGYNVPNGPQPFALVVDGNFGGGDLPPTVSITSPNDGDDVTGVIDITADANDDNGVTQVEFFVDGGSVGVDTTAPYAVSWDSSTVSDGPHTISATATDTIGQTGDDSIGVTVDNTPPTVSITSPTEGELVAGTIDVTADANDATTEVTQVEFFVDGGSIGVDTNGADGWSVSWDTTTASDGNHTLTATATDAVGLSGDSAGVGITVDNTPPTVSITSPTAGETVTGTIPVVADASDATSEVTQVEFFVDGGSIGTDTDGSDGWSVSWDTTSVSDGNHDLTATATDAAGNTGSSDPVTVNVQNGGGVTMHVGDLDGSSAWVYGTWVWQATVTIEVHDANHNPVADATVSATWSGGYSGSGECTTGADGRCSISTGYIWRNNTSTTFTVDDVTHATLSYNAADNHDPDGDSDGTTITVNRP